MLSPGMSAAVTTATFDQSNAGSRSMATKRAWASVERIVAPNHAPGNTRSSAYLAAPVSLSGPSRRSGAAPRARPGAISPRRTTRASGALRRGATGVVRLGGVRIVMRLGSTLLGRDDSTATPQGPSRPTDGTSASAFWYRCGHSDRGPPDQQWPHTSTRCDQSRRRQSGARPGAPPAGPRETFEPWIHIRTWQRPGQTRRRSSRRHPLARRRWTRLRPRRRRRPRHRCRSWKPGATRSRSSAR